MKCVFACLGFVIGTLISASPVFADPCLTAKPAPACRSCFITELGYGFRITPPLKRTSTQVVGDSITYSYESTVTGRHFLISEFGHLYNINAKYGVGFTQFTGWDVQNNLRAGVKLRMRKWLNQRASLDLSGGAVLWARSGEPDIKTPAFIGGASLIVSGWAAVDLMVEVLETKTYDYAYFAEDGTPLSRSFSPGRRNVGVYLGYRLSSKPGLIANGLAAAAVGVVGGIFAATYEGN